MLLIADSGSTKTDWALIKEDGACSLHLTPGINPVYMSTRDIIHLLNKEAWINAHADSVLKVRFYGAGCMSEMHCQVVEKALKNIFVQANDIRVRDDLTAAARATCGSQPGLVGILGTGANACYFDGEKIHQNTPSLGFILGDEASGAYFGKLLIRKILYNELPTSVIDDFNQKYKMDKSQIIREVYQNPNPHVFLARLMPFYTRHRQVLEIAFILKKGFREYLTHHILCYEQAHELRVHFVGSIAKIFHSELLETATSMDISLGKIIRSPIDALVKYTLASD